MAARRTALLDHHNITDDANDDNDDQHHSLSQPCVLILGGWSPGPLMYLKRYLLQSYSNNNSPKNNPTKHPPMQILQPSLSMPPLEIKWCLNAPFLLMVTLTIGFGYYAFTTCQRIYESQNNTKTVHYYQTVLLFTIMGLVWIRALVGTYNEWSFSILFHHKSSHHLYHGVLIIIIWILLLSWIILSLSLHSGHVVRYSIQHNVRLCQRLLAQHKVVLVIGFSWGAAMAAECIAQGILDTNDHNGGDHWQQNDGGSTTATSSSFMIPSLLIAPTTSLVAQLSLPRIQDAAMRVRKRLAGQQTIMTRRSLDDHDHHHPQNHHHSTAVVHVVHAYGDNGFCPHPERWNEDEEQEEGEVAGHDDTTSSSSSSSKNNLMIQLTMLQDNHVFLHPQSQRQLIHLLDNNILRNIQ